MNEIEGGRGPRQRERSQPDSNAGATGAIGTALARVCSSSAHLGTLAVLIGPVGLHGSRIPWALALITVGVSSLAGFVVYQLRRSTHCCILV
jgi:hypothetical protein